jgi:hypothetical protein
MSCDSTFTTFESRLNRGSGLKKLDSAISPHSKRSALKPGEFESLVKLTDDCDEVIFFTLAEQSQCVGLICSRIVNGLQLRGGKEEDCDPLASP